MKKDPSRYADIIDLPHHVSKNHRPMEISQRAAQFLPFAALTGYDSAIKEASRRTENKKELSEEEKRVLDEKIQILLHLRKPRIRVVYFIEDARKEGGAYVSFEGILRRIDETGRLLIFEDKTVISMDDIREITSEYDTEE